jgi:hypothetical protein
MTNRLKGSITLDSNPEGINQYTGSGSSKEAHELTAQANRIGSKEAHHEAALAHSGAAQRQQANARAIEAKSGNGLQTMSPSHREQHTKYTAKAKQHADLAAAHRSAEKNAGPGKHVTVGGYKPPSSIWFGKK